MVERLPDIIIGFCSLLGCFDGSLDGMSRDGFDDLGGDRFIDTQTTNPDAKPTADMTVIATAVIAVGTGEACAIEDPHDAAASCTTNETGQQRTSATRRLSVGTPLHVGVLRYQPLVRFEVFPAYVTGVMIPEQNIPGAHRLAVSGSLPGAALHHRCAVGGSAEDVSARVHRMTQYLQN